MMINPLTARQLGRATEYLHRHQPPRVLAEILVRTSRVDLFLRYVADIQRRPPDFLPAVGDDRFAPPRLDVVPSDLGDEP